jgi:hypothetical protein
MLAALVSLRVFEINTEVLENLPEGAFFPVIENVPDGAYLPFSIKIPPHLEHYAVFDGKEYRCWKQHCMEWIVCDQAECPCRPDDRSHTESIRNRAIGRSYGAVRGSRGAT